jgi:hypothetical protein
MNLTISNFVSEQERGTLASWILNNHTQNFFKDAGMGGIRRTTRFSTDANFEYPQEVANIRARIVDLLGLYEEEELNIYPPFKDGAVASIAYIGDTCFEHFDPVWYPGYNTLHCNVIVQAPDSGGELVLNGVPHEMKQTDLFCYLVSKHLHGTTKVIGDKHRLMFVFGFCVKDDKWENLVEKHR